MTLFQIATLCAMAGCLILLFAALRPPDA